MVDMRISFTNTRHSSDGSHTLEKGILIIQLVRVIIRSCAMQ